MSNPHGLVGSLSAVPLLTAALVAPAAALVTERVSLGALGARGNHRSEYPSFSADGRYVVFYSSASNLVSGDTNGFQDIFVRDRCGPATSATFSGDGINADTIAPASADNIRPNTSAWRSTAFTRSRCATILDRSRCSRATASSTCNSPTHPG